MDTHENQCGLNADTPERALDDAAESLPEEELLYDPRRPLFRCSATPRASRSCTRSWNDRTQRQRDRRATGTSQSAVRIQLRILKQALGQIPPRRPQYPLIAGRRPRPDHPGPRPHSHLRGSPPTSNWGQAPI
ncbi:MAG: hypothetical protein ACLTSX_02745 [Collinsella sp.]